MSGVSSITNGPGISGYAPSAAEIAAQNSSSSSTPGAGYTGYTYTYSQPNAATQWFINHNLGRYPSVNVADSSGVRVDGKIQWVDVNNITLTFSQAFAGFAYLN